MATVWKEPVRVVATSNLDLNGPEPIDGVQLSSGRVLVAGQTKREENGIYDASAGNWIRSADANTASEVKAGMSCYVEEGKTYAKTTWRLTTANPVMLGMTRLHFDEIGQLMHRCGVNVGGATAYRLEVKEPSSVDIARFEGNNSIGQVYIFQGITERGRIGYGGGMFTNGLTNCLGIRAGGTGTAPIQVGSGSTAAVVIAATNGYMGLGGITNPNSVLDVGGEASPRISITSNAAGAKRWQLVSYTNGDFIFHNQSDVRDVLTVTPAGDAKLYAFGDTTVTKDDLISDMPTKLLTIRGQNAHAAAIGKNKHGGVLHFQGGKPTDSMGKSGGVGIGSKNNGASGGQVSELGAHETTAVTLDGDRAAVTIKPDWQTGQGSQEGRFAANFLAQGGNEGSVFCQFTKYLGTSADWGGYLGWKYETDVRFVANTSRAPGGFRFGVAAAASPDNVNDVAVMTSSKVELYGDSKKQIEVNGTGIGCFGANPVAKPAVTGSRGGNAALASLLTALANLGLITDNSIP